MSTYLTMNMESNEKLKSLYNKIKKAKETWEDVFTNFLEPDEQILLKKLCENEDLYLTLLGGKGSFERALAVISNYEFQGEFPVDVIRISGNMKFEKLEHKDYLGAILSLGIKREKVGDINVYEDGAEIWASREISDYVCLNLNKIKHTGIKVEKIPFDVARERIQEYKNININVASPRLDCFVAEITGLSRTAAAGKIKTGDIKVNFNVEDESSIKINEGNILSIRGFGRFLVDCSLKTTKSGRVVYLVKKYV